MYYVEVYRGRAAGDELIGRIWFDGRRFLLDPVDNRVLERILNQPTRTRAGTLTAHGDPVRWLQSLAIAYQSPYVRVSELKSTEPSAAAASH